MSQVARPVSWRSNCKASLQRRALSQALRQLVRVKLAREFAKVRQGKCHVARANENVITSKTKNN